VEYKRHIFRAGCGLHKEHFPRVLSSIYGTFSARVVEFIRLNFPRVLSSTYGTFFGGFVRLEKQDGGLVRVRSLLQGQALLPAGSALCLAFRGANPKIASAAATLTFRVKCVDKRRIF
jgi:hypothetical protein